MNKGFKKTIATIAALCMTASAVLPLSASAGQLLGQLDFEKGVGLPWHVCESSPGEMTFEIEDGVFRATIVNPGGQSRGGEDRWDCQFRHRGLKINAGDSYTVKFELTASQSGKFYTKIGSLDGNTELWHQGSVDGSSVTRAGSFNQFWDLISVTAGQTYKMESTFTTDVSLDVAEWAFHLGGQGEFTSSDCFPAGTVIEFDNMSLVNNTRNDDDYKQDPHYLYERSGIEVNQLGYYKNLNKKATLVVANGDSAAKTFQIVDSKGETVYEGTTSDYKNDADSGDCVQIIDFSGMSNTIEGTGFTIKCDGKTSVSFNIGDWVYDGMLRDAMNYYYQNRSGVAIESKYITSGDTAGLSHPGGHKTDKAYIQPLPWRDDYASDGSDVNQTESIDVTGGWYDAGDHGKYVVNGGISVWTLNNIYERAVVQGDASKWADNNTELMNIPESGNGIPDILDETKIELDFFFKMQRADGMVYHKMHDYKWTALAVRPEDDDLIRIVKPVTLAATLNVAATAAQASRLWGDFDASYADTCLTNAKKAYSAAKANNASYDTNPDIYAPLSQSRGGGAYGDTEVRDDFYWAACELYLATGDQTYYNDMKTYQDAFKLTKSLDGGENSGSFSSFNWGCTAGLGTLSLSLHGDKLQEADKATVEASIVDIANAYVDEENKQGYGTPYTGTTFKDGGVEYNGYEWGSNSFVVNNAMVIAYAYDITKEAKYLNGTASAMDYIMGRNPLENSYVTGYGSYGTIYPHHRYWSWQVDEAFAMAPAGVLSGGPNSAMQDPYIKGAGYKVGTLAPQLCYLDHIESWSTNEVTINWNAPLAWLVSFLEDEAPNPTPPGPDDTTTSATTTGTDPTTTSATTAGTDPTTTSATTAGTDPTTSTSGTGGDRLWGDINCDGKVNAGDIVGYKNYFLEVEMPSAEGLLNADVKFDGKVNAADFIKIKAYFLDEPVILGTPD